ncbi:Crp/Fnr family transcriptional regulator [Chryseobacterium capnotolerans]|uniref:Crp/Fnr family transcriptional regulator n=1 Tax=Chryseobacterium capnotolerans TaxID=2759528 RepID=UPI003211AB36
MFKQLYDNISHYIDLSEEEFSQFSGPFQLKSFKKKETVLKEGEYCLFEGFVLNGCFKVYYLNENGFEQTLYFAIEGWWITDIDSLLNDVPSILNIEALMESEVLMISKKIRTRFMKPCRKLKSFSGS